MLLAATSNKVSCTSIMTIVIMFILKGRHSAKETQYNMNADNKLNKDISKVNQEHTESCAWCITLFLRVATSFLQLKEH
jgi:hypothetical protein